MTKLTKQQLRLIEICANRDKLSTDPIAVELRFVPTTGAIKPYEIWFKSQRNEWYQRQSFKSEAKAIAHIEVMKACFKI